jgi:hypothetical protein
VCQLVQILGGSFGRRPLVYFIAISQCYLDINISVKFTLNIFFFTVMRPTYDDYLENMPSVSIASNGVFGRNEVPILSLHYHIFLSTFWFVCMNSFSNKQNHFV